MAPPVLKAIDEMKSLRHATCGALHFWRINTDRSALRITVTLQLTSFATNPSRRDAPVACVFQEAPPVEAGAAQLLSRRGTAVSPPFPTEEVSQLVAERTFSSGEKRVPTKKHGFDMRRTSLLVAPRSYERSFTTAFKASATQPAQSRPSSQHSHASAVERQ